jgi:hypothetical protein
VGRRILKYGTAIITNLHSSRPNPKDHSYFYEMAIVNHWERYWLWHTRIESGGRPTHAPSRPDFKPQWSI